MINLEEKYRQAFSEVYEVMQIMPKELKNKISTKFYLMIERERNPYYHIDIVSPIENNNFKNETIVLLGLIYRDFLCSEEERKILQLQDAEEMKKIELEKKQAIGINELFKTNKKNNNSINNKNNSLIVLKKEKIYVKIFKILRKIIFKK